MSPDLARPSGEQAPRRRAAAEALGWRVQPAADGAAAGRLRGLTLPGVLQLLHLERRTCTVSVAGALGERGELHLDEGRLIHAEAGELAGEPAVHALCAGEAPEIVLAGLARPVEPTILRPLAQVLLEGARLADERRRREPGEEEGDAVKAALLLDDESNPPLYAVEGGALVGPDGASLTGLRLALPDGAVTVLLGPEGAGKSLLLRALAGRPLPGDWRRQGSWRRRGRDLGGADEEVLWLPQVRRRGILDAVERHELVRAVLGLLHSAPGSCLLLDEPTDDSITAPVAEIVRTCAAEGGGAVLATSDLPLARQVADYAVLLLPGHLAVHGAAPAFFDAPLGEPARRFLAQGS